jgi:hypothetical protein
MKVADRMKYALAILFIMAPVTLSAKDYSRAELLELQQELQGGVFENYTLPQLERVLNEIERISKYAAKKANEKAAREAREKRWAEGDGYADKPAGLTCDACAPGTFRSGR